MKMKLTMTAAVLCAAGAFSSAAASGDTVCVYNKPGYSGVSMRMRIVAPNINYKSGWSKKFDVGKYVCVKLDKRIRHEYHAELKAWVAWNKTVRCPVRHRFGSGYAQWFAGGGSAFKMKCKKTTAAWGGTDWNALAGF